MVLKYRSTDLTLVCDRAGVRVVVHLPSDVEAVCAAIRARFNDVDEEDVSERYGPDTFGYRGIHFDVRLPPELVDEIGAIEGGVTCEIQVRTVAEHAWSVLSHRVTYKSPGDASIPKPMMRRINRLIAIVELFDQEARAAETEITERPEYRVHRLAFDLERLFNEVVGDLLDSLPRCEPEFVDFLCPLYEGVDAPTDQLSRFANEHSERLRTLAQSFESSTSPLLHQPESLILCERLDEDAVSVVQLWKNSGYPMSLLEDVATLWGVDLPEI